MLLLPSPLRQAVLVVLAVSHLGVSDAQSPVGSWGTPGPALVATALPALVYRPADQSVYSTHGFVSAVEVGQSQMNDTYRLDLRRNSWTPVVTAAFRPRARFGHTVYYDSRRDRMVLFAGAFFANGRFNGLSDTHEFDFVTSTWHNVSDSFGHDRWSHTGTLSVAQDLWVVFGGMRSSANTALNDTIFFNTSSSTWSTPDVQGPLPRSRFGHTAVTTRDDRMIIFGGHPLNTQGGVIYNDVAVFHIPSQTWLATSAAGGSGPRLHGHAAVYSAARDAMIVFAGWTNIDDQDVGAVSNNVWLLDVVSFRWQLVPGLTNPPSRYATTGLLVGSSMLVYGGSVDGQLLLDDVQWFNINTPGLGGSTTSVPSPTTTSATTSQPLASSPVTLVMRINVIYRLFDQNEFVLALTRVLNIPAAAILILNIAPGSTFVTFQIVSTSEVSPQQIADQLIRLVTDDPRALGSVGLVNSVQQTSVVVPYTCLPMSCFAAGRECGAFPTECGVVDCGGCSTGIQCDSSFRCSDTTQRDLGIGLGVGFGGLLFLALLIVGALAVRQHHRRREQQQLENTKWLFDHGELLAMMPEFDQRYIIDYDTISIERELGKGAFGVVYQARYRGTTCVIKQNALPEQERKLAFLKEAYAMTRLPPFPNVVQLLGVCVDPRKPLAILLEWVDGGSLDQWLYDRNRIITPTMALGFCCDIAAGIQHLHASNILHCDISARNVLVAFRSNDRYIAKIADFGLSHFTRDRGGSTYSSASSLELPIRWTAPEVLENPRETSKAGDVWSIGVVMWEIHQRQLPYSEMPENSQVIAAVCRGRRLPAPMTVPHLPAVDKIIAQCLSTNPADRPTLEQLTTRLQAAFGELLEDSLPSVGPLESSPNHQYETIGPPMDAAVAASSISSSDATAGPSEAFDSSSHYQTAERLATKSKSKSDYAETLDGLPTLRI